MRPLRLALSASALGAALLLSHPAPASLIAALDTATMAQRADHIAVVDVVSTSAAWDDKHERILSTIELSVVESWKGSLAPAARVKVVQPGGTVGDITMVVFGMSRFSPGERALVFLQGGADSASVVGMSQGKRLVRRDLASGRWMVNVPEAAGASFVRTAPPSAATLPGGPANTVPVLELRARPLDDVRAQVRDLLRAKAQ
jgi:hypothetical protein